MKFQSTITVTINYEILLYENNIVNEVVAHN